MIQICLTALFVLMLTGCNSQDQQPQTAQKEPSPIQTKVIRITPSGTDILPTKEILFEFADTIVPLGKMDRATDEIHIDISPALECQWRWVDRSALACKLSDGKGLAPATTYNITLHKHFSSYDAVHLADTYQHSFSTQKPKVRYVSHELWKTPDIPYLHVYFNMPVSRASVQNYLEFHLDNNDSVAVAIMKKEQISDEQSLQTTYLPDTSADTHLQQEWIVAPSRALGLKTSATLVLKPGLIAASGTLSSTKEQVLEKIHTFDTFRFIRLRCDISQESHRCDPMRGIGLVFSAPVLSSVFKEALSISPSLNGGLKDFDPWANRYDNSQLGYYHSPYSRYTLWLPTPLKAFKEYTLSIDHNRLTDEFGRKLDHNITLTIATDHRSPQLKFLHRDVVLEKGIESDIPLFVTNINTINLNYTTLQAYNSSTTNSRTVATQKVRDLSYKIKLGIRDIFNGRSGALYAKISTPDIKRYYPRSLFAQITPFEVHAKLGHFNSLIWVTDFDSAQPVTHAKVTLYSGYFNDLAHLKELPYSGYTDENGLLTLAGTKEIDMKLQHLNWLDRDELHFFIKVQRGDDIALLPLNDDFTIRSDEIYSDMHRYGAHAKAWGTTAQGVYKLGDTVAYKIVVRDQNNTTLTTPKKGDFSLTVHDPLNKLIYQEHNITLNDYGSFSHSFKIPKEGAVGSYDFILTQRLKHRSKAFEYSWYPMSILVSDFTPAPFHVTTELNATVAKKRTTLGITTQASLLSGGPYANAPLRLTGHLKSTSFHSTHPLAKEFYFQSDETKEITLFNIQEQLDAKGKFSHHIRLQDYNVSYATLLFESSVKDERGKYIASHKTLTYAGVERFVGIKERQWVYKSHDDAEIELLVVNEQGAPVADSRIDISIEYLERKSSRVKGPGNAFVTKNSSRWVQESNQTLTSKETPLSYHFTPKHTGSYRFVAMVTDANGDTHRTVVRSYVSGYATTLWDQEDDSTLKIIPQSNEYRVGERAKYLVKNPFAGAKALVTIERYGILDAWVQELATNTPIIEVPIKPEYSPGFYLGVTVISGRVAKPLGEGVVDLGKPSYKMGYVRSRVTEHNATLAIDIATDKSCYAPAEQVNITMHVDSKKSNEAPYELAVVVIDQSVYNLNTLKESYYDPYLGFHELDALDVTNFALISRLIGRQKFEKKGANQGGDGGSTTTPATLRDNFKYIAYWNPNILTDSEGNATISFKAPDNLTGWNVIVMALGKGDQMAHNRVSFQTNRSTEIRPIMPNQILKGDRFSAGFSLLNRTDITRQIELNISLTGAASATKEETLTLKPFERRQIYIPVHATTAGTLTFDVTAHDAIDADRFKYQLEVHQIDALETAATFTSTTQNHLSQPLQIPDDIVPDVGSVDVVLSPSVLGNIEGAFSYLKEYPYWCWEQRLSKGVAASHYASLQEYLPDTFSWSGAKTLSDQMIEDASAFQAPNGGMAFWDPKNEYVSPYLSAYTALAFEWLHAGGHTIAKPVRERLHHYLKTLLDKDAFADNYSKSMRSTIRAVALNALAHAKKLNAQTLERYFRHYPDMTLFGRAHYLEAMLQTGGVKKEMKKELLDSIFSTASQSAGKIQFNELVGSGSSYLLTTPMRTNCAILSTMIAAQQDEALHSSIGDVASKMVRAISQARGTQGYWGNTQENIFCMNALSAYAKAYEQHSAEMNVTLMYDTTPLAQTAFYSKKDTPITITKELNQSDIGALHTLKITKEGAGRLYCTSRLSYTPKTRRKERINSGMEIVREYSIKRNGHYQLLKDPIQIKRGDIVRVDLFISVPTARYYVVVNDPIAGGLEAINSDLATTSIMDAQGDDFKAPKGSWYFKVPSWSSYGRYGWSFYHKELRDASARFYSDYLPAGAYHLHYTAQAIAEGEFSIMPSHIEEMYDPDIYGKSLPMTLKVTR